MESFYARCRQPAMRRVVMSHLMEREKGRRQKDVLLVSLWLA